MMHNILPNFMFLGVSWIQLFWILKFIFSCSMTHLRMSDHSQQFFFCCRFIFCRAVLFYFHPEEHEQHLPTCLPNLPESVSPTVEAIKTPILLLAENLVVSNRFHFRDSRHNKKWSTAMTIDQAFCRYLLGKYSPAICWLFPIYTANGEWLGINKLLQRLGDLSGDTKSFACCFISIVRLYKFV